MQLTANHDTENRNTMNQCYSLKGILRLLHCNSDWAHSHFAWQCCQWLPNI